LSIAGGGSPRIVRIEHARRENISHSTAARQLEETNQHRGKNAKAL
jgi:hypothetical protein